MTAQTLSTYCFEDLSIGMRETITRTVTDADVVGFAQVSGDRNPIHLSDDYASRTRFGQRIAHGLYTASLVSAVLGTKLPGPGGVYLSQTLNFKAPVRIGDTVTSTVEIIELIEHGRRCRLFCKAAVDGHSVLEGEALVMVPGRATD